MAKRLGDGRVERFVAGARQALRRDWVAGGAPWGAVLPRHSERNLAIARAYLETDEPIRSIAARNGVTGQRVLPIARALVYAALGQRPPRR
jgi:hypothetical protein